MLPKLRFVVATREKRENFHTATAIGKSLAAFKFPFIEFEIFGENSTSLSTRYNEAVERAIHDPAILIFVHDDVYFCDYYWVDELINALSQFDIVGVAGNKRRRHNQPAWAFADTSFQWDSANLSGVVGHGKTFPPSDISYYGSPLEEVKLLDGLLLAVKSETLRRTGIRFDERFSFHFYDMDLCRQAEKARLKMGTCALSLQHQSQGAFGTPAWTEAYQAYIEKWQG